MCLQRIRCVCHMLISLKETVASGKLTSPWKFIIVETTFIVILVGACVLTERNHTVWWIWTGPTYGLVPRFNESLLFLRPPTAVPLHRSADDIKMFYTYVTCELVEYSCGFVPVYTPTQAFHRLFPRKNGNWGSTFSNTPAI